MFAARVLLASCLGLTGQEPATLRAGEPLRVELTADDAPLDDLGASRRLRFEATVSGRFYAWALSDELDPLLVLEDAAGVRLADDRDSGGGVTPWLRTTIEPGRVLHVVVAATTPAEVGRVEVHVAVSPETDRTRAVAAVVLEKVVELEALARAGEPDRAQALLGEVLEEALVVPGVEQSAELAHPLWKAGFPAYHLLRDLHGASRAWEVSLALFERTRSPDHPDLQWARGNYALTIKALGDLGGARELEELVLAARERTLPPDHPDVQTARTNLAATLAQLGELHEARGLEALALDARERTLPEDHPALQTLRLNHANTTARLGDLERASELCEQALVVMERNLPPDHPELLRGKTILGRLRISMGDGLGAFEVLDEIYRVQSARLPADHVDLQATRGNLAHAMNVLGDQHGAIAMQERALEIYRANLEPEHPLVQQASVSLAASLYEIGDLVRALALFESALEVESRRLPDDHVDLAMLRGNLAMTLDRLGHGDRALPVFEKVYEVFARTHPEDNPERLRAAMALGAVRLGAGDTEPAIELLARAHEGFQVQGESSTSLQRARLLLAKALSSTGRLEEARELEELACESLGRFAPTHSLRFHATAVLLETLVALGETDPARARLLELSTSLRQRLMEPLLSSSPREAETLALDSLPYVSRFLSYSAPGALPESGAPLDEEAFALVEAHRGAGLLGAHVLAGAGEGEELDLLRARVREAGARVAARAASGEPGGADLLEAIGGRDRAQRELLRHVSATSGAESLPDRMASSAIAARLQEDQAAVGFWRYHGDTLEPGARGPARTTVRWLAFVVRPGEPLARIELGPADAIDDAVFAWRDAVQAGPSAEPGRGEPLSRPDVEPALLVQAGERLRSLVLDPLRPRLGDARRLVLALDGPLHAVPLDALPVEGGLVGAELELEVRTTLWELVPDPPAPRAGRSTLVVVGNVDYGSLPGSEDSALPLVLASAAQGAPARLVRAGPWLGGFPPLAATGAEVDAIAVLFPGSEESVVHLRGAGATLERLVSASSEARFLHLATHGFFAPESVAPELPGAVLDPGLGLLRASDRTAQVQGLSPMVLCGLALSGANSEADDYGRLHGVLTAEELATWDLRGCELAVLSACDTNVGLHQAGQGVASLQKALHMAGARRVVTSLWKVPDQATRDLMVDFYRRMWREGVPPRRALWEAKMELRARGHPARDWAGWVLSG